MKTKALTSCAITAQLICAFVFAYAKSRFFHDAAHVIVDIQIVQFAESRAAEIKALEKNITTFKGTKSIQQRLPKHMRRRAMSHNIKRLPKNQRAMAEKSVSIVKNTENLPVH